MKTKVSKVLFFRRGYGLSQDYVAKELGCDIDQPRNLAKSVTVE